MPQCAHARPEALLVLPWKFELPSLGFLQKSRWDGSRPFPGSLLGPHLAQKASCQNSASIVS